MPKFAPNTGFKMPGVGSKNIDSPGNFRDEQHVDKMGYCDTTEDSMLPEGSSPLKARYTTSGYLKDIKVLDLGSPKKKPVKKEPAAQQQTSTPPIVKEKTPPDTSTEDSGMVDMIVPEYNVDLPEVPDKKYVFKNNKTGKNSTRTKDTSTRKKTWEDMRIDGASEAEITDAKNWRKNNKDVKNVGVTTTTYTVNGKKTDKAGYDAAGPGSNRSKS